MKPALDGAIDDDDEKERERERERERWWGGRVRVVCHRRRNAVADVVALPRPRPRLHSWIQQKLGKNSVPHRVGRECTFSELLIGPRNQSPK